MRTLNSTVLELKSWDSTTVPIDLHLSFPFGYFRVLESEETRHSKPRVVILSVATDACQKDELGFTLHKKVNEEYSGMST